MTAQSEELSKYIFGSSYMLAVLIEIARAADGQFSTPQLVTSTGLSQSTVHAQITRLRRAQLVRRSGGPAVDRIAIYERRDHPIWELALSIEHEFDLMSARGLTDPWLLASADS